MMREMAIVKRFVGVIFVLIFLFLTGCENKSLDYSYFWGKKDNSEHQERLEKQRQQFETERREREERKEDERSQRIEESIQNQISIGQQQTDLMQKEKKERERVQKAAEQRHQIERSKKETPFTESNKSVGNATTQNSSCKVCGHGPYQSASGKWHKSSKCALRSK